MSCFLATLSAKATLALAMWACFLWWIFQWYVAPAKWWGKVSTKIEERVESKYFDKLESHMLYYGAPPIVIAYLSIIYFGLPNKVHLSHLKISKAFYSLWGLTFVLPSPFGIMKFGEIVFGILVSVLIAWYVSMYTKMAYDRYDTRYATGVYTLKELWERRIDYIAEILGVGSAIAFSLLFFPVSRRSPILRIIGTPYELAIRYHIWLGHVANFFSTLHGVIFLILWSFQKKLLEEVVDHGKYDIGNIGGLILFVISIIIWVSSMEVVRKKFFEIFFYTHQLYLLYLLFYVFHIGGWIIVWPMSGLFLFFLDRLLRFFQSRYPVDVVSAKALPNGYLQLTLPTSEGLQVDSLGIFFVNVPLLSRLQWHPFSLSSRSMGTPGYVSILIKPTMDEASWTSKLSRLVSAGNLATVYVEGPYNSELHYINRYDALILVAGGAGITPFISIVHEVIHLHLQELRAPSAIELIWIVKDPSELELLSVERLPSEAMKDLKINVRLFVTSRLESSEVAALTSENSEIKFCSKDESSYVRPIVLPVGSRNGATEFFVTSFTFVGTIFVMVLFCRNVIYPIVRSTGEETLKLFRGAIFLFSFLIGVLAFGCIAATIDRMLFSKPKSVMVKEVKESFLINQVKNGESSLLQGASVNFGGRPDMDDVFNSACENLEPETNVGVMVCGPYELAKSVARQCQKRSFVSRYPQTLNFHSLSFEF